jgi:hypothetical protein
MAANTAASDALHACRYCGVHHPGECPRVKAIDYYPDGTTKRVEFHGPPSSIDVTYPEERSFQDLREMYGGDERRRHPKLPTPRA